jgi:DNA-binding transcriptional LysR family regulator
LDDIPLAVLEKPCRFREAAVASLEASGRSYRIAVETPNLSTLRAAVESGLGVTCRTRLFLPATSEEPALPGLPNVACIVARAAKLSEPTALLADLAEGVIREL